MTKPVSFTRQICAVLGALALFSASAAVANEVTDLDVRASAEYNRGLDARNAGRNDSACQHFRNSAVLYENSIYAMMGSLGSEAGRNAVKDMANMQQTSANNAKFYAKEVCGRPNSAALISPVSNANRPDIDYDYGTKEELRRTQSLAQNQYKESVRLWDAGDRSGACAMIRTSAAGYAKVVDALKANKALESAFYPVTELYANATLVTEVRDETFCSKVAGGQRDSLQRDTLLAITKGKEAKRLYEADDLAGSCAAARLSTDAYDRITSAMRTDPALRAAFDDPENVFENAKIMADHRDRFYCAKPG